MRIRNVCIAFTCFLFCFACTPSEDPPQDTGVSGDQPNPAQEIIDGAIAAHGSQLVAQSRISFDFRGRHYSAERRGGFFTYERVFADSSGQEIRDILSNDGLVRMAGGQPAVLSARDSAAYANSVNSVLYFALLPYFLNDEAVIKEYLGEVIMRNAPYQKVRITFRQEGGGKDFEDQFVYWVHKDNKTIDYLGYNYRTSGGGARFREAYNVRKVEGIRFCDYINYGPGEKRMDVENFDRLFERDSLEEVSRIEVEKVAVELLEAE